MFRLLFHKGNQEQQCEPDVRGVQAEHSTVVWDTRMDYRAAKQFVDHLNKTKLQEDALFDAAWEFVMKQADTGTEELSRPETMEDSKE